MTPIMRKQILVLILACVLPMNMIGANWIKEVAISGDGDKNTAKNYLRNNGYTIIDKDLNDDAGGWYIYLGYKLTDKYEEAITNLMVMNGTSFYTQNEMDNVVNVTEAGKKWEYHPVKRFNINFNGDLNKKAGGADLFLYYTRSNITSGEAISGLEVIVSGSGKSNSNYVKEFNGNNIYGNMDCNKDAGGNYVYIQKSMSSYNATSSQLDSEFRVLHHGGRLYQLLIPVGVAQEGKPTLTMGTSGHDLIVEAGSDNNTMSRIFSLGSMNTNNLNFDSEWEIRINNIDKAQGNVLDEESFDGIDNGRLLKCSMGNHLNKKMVSVLWLASERVNPSSFRIYCENAVSGTSTFKVDKKRSPETEYSLATGMNNVTVIEPFMDMENSMAGWLSSYVSSVQKFYSLGIWDGSANEFLICDNYTRTDGRQEVNFNIPSSDNERDLVALMYSQYVTTMSDGAMDTTYVLLNAPFTAKAVHTIARTGESLWTTRADETTGIPHDMPVIDWAIKYPKDDDLLSSDQFIITRSGTKDFDSSTIVTSFGVQDTTSTEMIGDTLYGWFHYVDSLDKEAYVMVGDAEATMYLLHPDMESQPWYRSLDTSVRETLKQYTLPRRKMYYNISRAVINGIWPDDSTGFSRTLEVPLTAALPTVNEVHVKKLSDWDTSHKVEVTVRLNNPYFWQLASSAQQQNVRNVLEQQGINHRMFVWDTNAFIQVERYSPQSDHWTENGKETDYAAKTFTLSGKDVKWNNDEGYYYVTFTDYQSAPYTYFYYKAKVDDTEALYPTCTGRNQYVSNADSEAYRIESMAFLSGAEASTGTYPGLVYVTWEIGEGMNDGFRLYRRIPGKNEWTELTLDDAKATSYKDTDVLPGTVYEYKIVADVRFKGKDYQDTAYVYGTPSYCGTIKGKVCLGDGSGMPGKLTIRIQRIGTKAFSIPDMHAADGSLLLKGYSDNGFDKQVTVAEDGTFEIDDIPYSASGIQYQLEVRGSDCSFKNPAGVFGAYTVLMDKENYEVTQANFTCSDMHHISGYVMFDGSTVPSRYVHFKVNGVPVTDANGKLVETDQKGAFSFYVPKTQVTIQAYRDGHEFKGGGYILGGTKADQKTFTPMQDYDGVRIWDQTKVRLVGRMAGGNNQAKLPQGLGFGTNNLGDDLVMVLQLEGDESAQIVYNQNDPDKVQRDTVFTQSILLDGKREMVDDTEVSFQKKRIVVHPDVKTGEFCLDLYPTKYKVVQLSAKGYSTLFGEGEGFEVIDLTNDTVVTSVRETLQMGRIKETRSGQYQAVYQKIYHNEASLTYMQADAIGNDMGYLGEKTVTEASLTGTDMTAPLTWFDKEANQQQYLFGYPVFQQGNKYFFKVTAHEDYYYNGDRTRQPDVVYLDKGSLTVYNGLESSTSTVKAELDTHGSALVVLTANNPTFTYTGEEALRKVNMQVNIDGYYYRSDTLKAYVLGVKREGTDFATFGNEINVLDVVRDPYGASSYAYREAGTKYYWNHNRTKTTTCSFNLKTNIGYGSTLYVGLGLATKNQWSATFNGGINIPMTSDVDSKNGEYTMTLNERISTSSAAFDEGACADVYIGTVGCLTLGKSRAFTVIDASSYDYLKKAIDNKTVQLVRQGKDKNGSPYYLVIGEKLLVGDSIKSTFAYSQKFILGTLIPNMVDELDQMVLDCTQEEAESLAKATGERKYYYKAAVDKTSNDTTWTIQMATPNNKDVFVNEAQELQNSINAWINAIAENEQKKLDMINRGTVFKHYSVANTSINYTESSSTYYTHRDSYKTFSDDNFSGAISGNIGGGGGGTNNRAGDVEEKSNTENKYPFTAIEVGGLICNLSFGFDPSTSWNNTMAYYRTTSAGAGFVLSMANNSYMDMDVYRYVDRTVMGQKEWDFITSADDDSDEYKETVSEGEFVFVARSGASRNPWLAPDSTIAWVDKTTGKGFPLGEQLLKIDNPRIYIDQPVVSNVPKSERAVFTVRMANESEISKDAQYLIPSKFKLRVEDKSNPSGVKVFMDGQPVTEGRTFQIAPGTSVTKTFEVERGVGYDFENIKLRLSDESVSLTEYATFSVHFLPESTPVKLVQPVNGWVINTLSPVDSIGYYLPVEISGFDINYENFDHIELQYKKTTEGENQWVNVCSYYANDSVYEAATGNKERITSGNIKNIRFYGAADPVEVGYDLRAVSFCRLGTGFVSKASEVMSGLKDTRCPQVFGLPKPADGILSFDEIISLPFNEDVAFNNLNAVANFQIQGYTNNSDMDHQVSVRFQDEDVADNDYTYPQATYAYTSVERCLSDRDFSIDMMAKIENKQKTALLYLQEKVIGVEEGAFYFGYSPQLDCLFAYMDHARFLSDELSKNGLSVSNVMTHLGMTYRADDGTIQFFVGDKILDSHGMDGKDQAVCRASGQVVLGYGLTGNMTDVRLWGKVLDAYEIGNKYGKRLSDNETGLIAYWRLDEGSGFRAGDYAGGADLTFKGCNWETPAGYSLRLEGQPVRLRGTEKFQCSATADYSLSFWFRSEKQTADAAALFRAGGDDIAETGLGKLWIGFKNGELVCRSNGIDHTAGDGKYADGQWHRFTLVVDHSQNVASIYVDQNLKTEFKASEADGVANDCIVLGDNAFSGNIDELSFWHLALPYSYLQKQYNTALSGSEMELQVYLPFEMDQQNDQATMFADFSPYNMKKTSAGVYDLSVPMMDKSDAKSDNAQRAPIRSNTGLENFPFDWVCTNNELQIDIKKADKDINHQQIFLTVRGVEDKAGNMMEQPKMWSVYADRNVLKWNEHAVDVNATYGNDTTLVVGWKNISGRSVNFTIAENCSWLTASQTMGTIAPMEESEVTIEITDGLAPGKYSTTLYLTDDNGLASPMTVNVTIEAIQPVWIPTSDKNYNQSMLLVGQVYVKDLYGDESIDVDKRDLVGVFADGVCVGVSNIVAQGATGKGEDSNVYLNILGTSKMNPRDNTPGQLLEFRLWDASKGTISILVPDTIHFANNKAVGVVPDAPVQFHASEYKVQEISLQEGWNWVSFNVEPLKSKGLSTLFMDNDAFSSDDIIQHVGDQNYGVYDANGTWAGSARYMDISYKKVYLMYMHKPGVVKVKGRSIDDKNRVVHIDHSNRWNELPYLLEVAQPIQRALSDYPLPFESASSKATEGDWVKSHDEFAIATSTGWVGSLKTMRPGVGYYLFHKGDACDIKYTNNDFFYDDNKPVGDTPALPSAVANASNAPAAANVASMPAVLALADESQYKEGDLIVAYADGKEAGHAACTSLEGNMQRFFLMINAEEGAKIQLALVRDGEVTAITSSHVAFDGDGMLGSLARPYRVDFSEVDADVDVYDLLGRRYTSPSQIQGVYIHGNKKIMKLK